MNNQNVKAKSRPNTKGNVKLITITAMFAALVTVLTMFPQIPSPDGHNYAHAGDSMIYLAASILPGPFGIIASSIGGALADIISGYAYWAFPTAIIKALNAVPFVVCGMILNKYNKNNKIINIPNLLMLIPTTCATVFGYFFANAFMFGWEAAIAGSFATWWLQPGVGALLYIGIGKGLDAVNFKQKMLSNIAR